MKPSTHGGFGRVMIVGYPIPKPPKIRDKDREKQIHYWEWFCPFLDDVFDDMGEDLGVHNGGRMSHSQTPKSRNKGMDIGIRNWERLSPFLNDKTLNDDERNDAEPQIMG